MPKKHHGSCPNQKGGSRKPIRGSKRTDAREENRLLGTNSPNFRIYSGVAGRRFIYKQDRNGNAVRVYLDPPKRK